MKTHLNTLFVTTQGSYLAKEGQAVLVKVEQEIALRVPLHNLDGIVAFGHVGCSPSLMGACAEAGVTLSFLTEWGKFLARVSGFTPGNVLLRRQQYRLADLPEAALEISRSIVLGKVANCRTVLLRGARDAISEQPKEALQKTVKRMSASIVEVQQAQELDALRGLEGEAATQYFSSLNHLIRTDDETFRYVRRSRRPPLDALNCLLSFVYSLLTHDVRSACEATGLDAAVGYLHRDRPGRPGLALDLMEEFRPWLADRLVLSLINRKQVNPNGFQTLETGAVVMSDDTRKSVLVAWQERKQDSFRHPFLDETVSIGMAIHLQARLFARHLRGDLDAYPPLLWK